MVKFENIRVEGMYIYAHEIDMMTGVSCDVKLHVRNEEYSYNCQMTGSMIRALWNLQSRLEKRKLFKVEVISWG